MRIRSITIITACLLAGIAFGQKKNPFNSNELKVTWQLLANNYENRPENISFLTLENTGKHLITPGGWSIFFNFNRHITPSSITGQVSIEHVNGDIYRLRPEYGFNPLSPGSSSRVSFVSEGNLYNYTAAPCGFYIVFDQDPGKGMSLGNFLAMPMSDSTSGFVTPRETYLENQSIIEVDEDNIPLVFPTPVSYRRDTGYFLLDKNNRIHADASFDTEANYLSSELEVLTGDKFPVDYSDNPGKGIILKKSDLPGEAYTLNVSSYAIEICASSGTGIFYGIQSLRSLIAPSSWQTKHVVVDIPCAEVSDSPRFGFRSLMLDVARNFQTVEQLKKMLDLMALYKLNVLHLHFSDDEGWRIEIPSLPELTSVGASRGHTLDSRSNLPPSYGAGPEPGKAPGSGYYTRTDFVEILKYAKERHIEIIPEIESPGHSRAAIKAMDARYRKYKALGNMTEAEHFLLRDLEDKSTYSSAQLWTDNVMCVARPSVYSFLEKVIDELEAMYAEANAPLTTIHMGGDEVPAGVWEQSPICRELIEMDLEIKTMDDLWYYYYSKVNEILKSRNLALSGWEEIAMRKTELDGEKHFIPNPLYVNENFRVHVWNNGIGWGSEDLPYRLANAGYKVVLSCVSNQYFDLAYEKSPDEPGLYWGGFVDTYKPFSFIPFDYYRNTREDTGGNPISPSLFIGKDRLTDYGKTNILGIQGLLWAENIITPEREEYMLLPKLLALAERAWARDPDWAVEKDSAKAVKLADEAWSRFASTLGKRELPRLSYLDGGFNYRVPPAGAIVKEDMVFANCQFPGITIRYTLDGSDPNIHSPVYSLPIASKGKVRLATFSVDGRRGRIIEVGTRVK